MVGCMSTYLRTGLDMARGVATPSALMRCCMVGVADDGGPPPRGCCCCCCCWDCIVIIGGGPPGPPGWSGDSPSGVKLRDGSSPRCRGCGLCRGWYMRICCCCCCCWRGESPPLPTWDTMPPGPSSGGRKKLLLEPWRCSGGVGSQSRLWEACGSMSMSEHSRPGDSCVVGAGRGFFMMQERVVGLWCDRFGRKQIVPQQRNHGLRKQKSSQGTGTDVWV